MSVRNHFSLRTVDEFYVLDLDRCLLDTEKVQAFLEHVLSRDLAIDPQDMNVARREVEQSGGSFDTATYVMNFLDEQGKDGPALWHSIKRRFIEEAQKEDMLQSFARQFIYELRLRKAKYGIVTFGGDAWQSAKIAAAGLEDVPFLITHELEKGRLLSSWQRKDGTFLIPRQVAGSKMYAKRLVFVDDKPVSFVGLPDGVRGVWAIAPGTRWPKSAYEQLPNHTTPVQGMHGAIELLFSHENSSIVDKT